jgi:putative flippase GtrA
MARSQTQKGIRFLAVGGLGFCVDLGVLLVLVYAGMSGYLARIVSLACSITLTWMLNRHISFGRSADTPVIEYVRYAVVALGAAAVNYAVYAACLTIAPAGSAMIAGSAVAMLLTFTGYDRWVFAARPR